ncbi:hypothetical protein Tco_1444144 [Tanacetum coccineum]
MAALKFTSSHNMVAFLDKPIKSDGFEQIVDLLNAHPITYALTIQALVDKKKVIITETSVRSDLKLDDSEGTECLPNATIFEQLTLMSAKTTTWNEFSRTMASAIICFATNQKFNFFQYIFDNMVKNLEGGVKFIMYPRKRQGKDFSGRDTPLFSTMIVQAQEQAGEDETENVESVPTYSNDPLLSGEERLKLNELMELYTNLSQRVLVLENTKTSQAAEITKLKERAKTLERRNKSRTPRLKRLRKVGRTA